MGGYFFFPGLCLFGRLLLFVFDKIPKTLLIWGATTIRQERVTFYHTNIDDNTLKRGTCLEVNEK